MNKEKIKYMIEMMLDMSVSKKIKQDDFIKELANFKKYVVSTPYNNEKILTLELQFKMENTEDSDFLKKLNGEND